MGTILKGLLPSLFYGHPLLFLLLTTPLSLSLASTSSEVILHVNPHHISTSDHNAGTKEKPFTTISSALHEATKYRKRGFPTTVRIHPGTYRENIQLTSKTTTASMPRLVIEASQKHLSIITGSDVWTNWIPHSTHGIYVHSWPYHWGLQDIPREWHTQISVKPIVRRREMIFIDGHPLKQVLSRSDLTPGTFTISETDSHVYLIPPPNTNMDHATVEVGIRSGLFLAKGQNNLTVRGLRFQHDTTGITTFGAAMHVVNSQHVVIEDCQFEWNNWFGLRLTAVNHVTTRRNQMRHNGGGGWEAWKLSHLISEYDETSYNNWRGARGGFLGWSVAGAKHLRIHHGTYRHFLAEHNATRGLWFDFDNSDVMIENLCIQNNRSDGLNIEASPGPITITSSQIKNNKGHGVVVGTSSHITLTRSDIADNQKIQIKLHGGPERTVDDWETGKQHRLYGQHIILDRNMLRSTTAQLVTLQARKGFLPTFHSDHNRWIYSHPEKPFSLNQQALTFMGWQTTTLADTHSSFAYLRMKSQQPQGSSCSQKKSNG